MEKARFGFSTVRSFVFHSFNFEFQHFYSAWSDFISGNDNIDYQYHSDIYLKIFPFGPFILPIFVLISTWCLMFVFLQLSIVLSFSSYNSVEFFMHIVSKAWGKFGGGNLSSLFINSVKVSMLRVNCSTKGSSIYM